MASNVSQSVRDCLLNRTRETGEDHQVVLIRFALERLLYRMTQLPEGDDFALMGTFAFLVWSPGGAWTAECVSPNHRRARSPCGSAVYVEGGTLLCREVHTQSTGGGTRTHTGHRPQRILSPLRLPIPPPRQEEDVRDTSEPVSIHASVLRAAVIACQSTPISAVPNAFGIQALIMGRFSAHQCSHRKSSSTRSR